MLFIKKKKIIFVGVGVVFCVISLSCNRWLDLWLLIELVNFCFIPVLIVSETNHNKRLIIFKYYCAMTVFSFFYLIRLIWYFNTLSHILFNVVFCAKLNIAPLHKWLYYIVKKLDYKSFLYIITINKIPRIAGLVNIFNIYILFFFAFLSMLISRIEVFKENNTIIYLFYSSVYNSSWVIACMLWGLFKEALYFFFLYAYILILITTFLEKNKVKKLSEIFKKWEGFEILIYFLILIRIPPTSGFFIKIIIVYSLFKTLSSLIFFLLMTSCVTFIFWVYHYLIISLKIWFLYNNNSSHPTKKRVYRFFINNFSHLIIFIWFF